MQLGEGGKVFQAASFPVTIVDRLTPELNTLKQQQSLDPVQVLGLGGERQCLGQGAGVVANGLGPESTSSPQRLETGGCDLSRGLPGGSRSTPQSLAWEGAFGITQRSLHPPGFKGKGQEESHHPIRREWDEQAWGLPSVAPSQEKPSVRFRIAALPVAGPDCRWEPPLGIDRVKGKLIV